ncbi:MAG: gamma-glutamyltransferase [Candidatus Velthaea sp.]
MQILNVLQRYARSDLARSPADFYHFIIEATKQAFVDRDAWIADPLFHAAPLAELLSPARRGRARGGDRVHRGRPLPRPAGRLAATPYGCVLWMKRGTPSRSFRASI